MGKIFISYRRKDWTFAHSLHEQLQKQIKGEVWIDLEIDRPDFAENIEEELRTSDVYVLVVTENTFAEDRIHNDDDWIRREIRIALAENKPIALAIRDGQMPDNARSLPSDIEAISGKHGIAIYPGFFDEGVTKLANHCTALAPEAFPRPNRKLWIASGAIALMALVSLLVVLWINAGPEIDSVGIEGRYEDFVVGYDANGRTLWRRQVDGRISEAVLEDLDSDGSLEVLIGVDNSMESDEPDVQTGWLIVYDESGNVVDTLNTWEPSIYNAGDSENMRVSTLEVADLDGDERLEVVAVSNATYWFASKISVLHFSDGHLRMESRYWNPGLLYLLYIGDSNDDQVLETVVTGVNNNVQGLFHQLPGNMHVVFAFEGDNISGQAPPPGFTMPDTFPPGSEIWYRYLTPETARVTTVRFERDRIQIGLNDACNYYLESDGNLLTVGGGTICDWESTLYPLTQRLLEEMPVHSWIDDTGWFTFYTFDGEAGETITSTIRQGQDSDLIPAVQLYDAALNLIASQSNPQKSPEITLTATLPETGFYYLQVTRFGGEDGKTFGSYLMDIQRDR